MPALSTVRLGYTGSDHRSFHLLQDGEGEQQYGALAAGYKRDGAFDLLGGLTYSHHTTTGIKWSNVTDLDKTGPYILADTLGGTTYGEQYHLWGGASRQLGAHAFHLNLSYRAYGSYRQKDPRASIKVSDFTIGLGWARRIGKHLFGLSAEYNRYRQYASVRNYKDDGRALTNFYVLNGLGFYSDILSGAEYTYGVAYHGAGFNLAFQWIPQAPTGLYLTGQYRGFSNAFLHSNYTYGVYAKKALQAEGGYRMAFEKFTYAFKAHVNYLHGRGTEYLYKVVVVDHESRESDRQLLSRLPKYSREELNCTLALLTTYNTQGYLLSAEAGGGFQTEAELYQKGTFFTRFKNGAGHLILQGQKFTDKATWGMRLQGQVQKIISADQQLLSTSDGDARYVVTRSLVLPDFNTKKLDLYRAKAGLSLIMPVKQNLAIHLGLNYEITSNTDRSNHFWEGSVGFFF